MKKIILAGMLVVLLGAALLTGCSRPAPAAPTPTAVTTAPADNGSETAIAPPAVAALKTSRIGDILQDPGGFGGKTVVVEGKISSECPSGCWFTLKDGNAVIYIDLNPSNMVIPQKKGSYAKVTAEVVNEGGDVYLIGKKVDF
ncbi:MAG: hypothetical protein NT177_01830 [Chloroflexi bacterium]|jgi:hypothetical protein|nr:hypothetical protein [Chloroflexota bacterium]